MGHTKRVKEAGRYGSRYGSTVRKRVLKILSERHSRTVCAGCGKSVLMRRISVGVWECPSCGYTYAGPAHTPKS
ncbi:MAG: 50S ribosomal protein L37ae [Candidatus Marsarchaeota archaeon]|nr:50S ribosomal protein L37ae [Candidatus Marsarchaeota archaeon]